VKLIGIEHVGIASDFGGGDTGWNDAGETFNVTWNWSAAATPKSKSPNWAAISAGIRDAERVARKLNNDAWSGRSGIAYHCRSKDFFYGP
jgi:microsomal dipeptidase-like Zn-dependent dipeptidase